MRKRTSRFVVAALLVSCAMPGMAQAQTATATPTPVAHPKPVYTRDMCVGTPLFELVQKGAPTSYRTTSSTVDGGYDPAGAVMSCGPVTRAQPLACVDGSGAPASPENCLTGAKADYESKYVTTVYRGPDPDLSFYTVDSTLLGSAPMATAIRIKAGVVNSCIQVAELEAYADGVNVALASNGATASGTPPWSGDSNPSKAIDGVRPAGYPNIYHSQCSGGDYLLVTFARPARVSKMTLYGRGDGYGDRDLYAYELLNGSNVVGTGQIDARSGSGSVSLAGSCDAEQLEWRTTKAPVAGICGTQTVQDKVECVDVSGGGSLVVDASRCNASQRPANAPYSVTSREGCGYDFTASAWSLGAPACGTTTQTRTVACVGSDGQPADESACANYLTAPSADTPASSYWSKGAYAWPGAPGDSITVYRMPSVCNVGTPDQVRQDCDAAFINKNGASASYLKPKSSRTVADQRACTGTQTGGGSTYAWNSPVYVPDRTGVCGANTRTGHVACLRDGTTEVDASFCDAATKPASVQTFQDTSGCTTDGGQTVVASISEVRLNTCNYTSSGGGRYACGPRENYRPGPAAPWPADLCSGSVIAGDPNLGDHQTPNAGKGWTKQPVVDKVAGARCVVHMKYGYSDSSQAGWNSIYYDGPPTGRAGGEFIGRKP